MLCQRKHMRACSQLRTTAISTRDSLSASSMSSLAASRLTFSLWVSDIGLKLTTNEAEHRGLRETVVPSLVAIFWNLPALFLAVHSIAHRIQKSPEQHTLRFASNDGRPRKLTAPPPQDISITRDRVQRSTCGILEAGGGIQTCGVRKFFEKSTKV